jgi:hypothetical protein
MRRQLNYNKQTKAINKKASGGQVNPWRLSIWHLRDFPIHGFSRGLVIFGGYLPIGLVAEVR